MMYKSSNLFRLNSARRLWSTRMGASLLLALMALAGAGCRMDMQDQPKLIAYRRHTFFKDGSGMRPVVEGTVPRGYLRADKELYTGKKEGVVAAGPTAPTVAAPGAAPGSTAQATNLFPDAVEEFPLPVTKELVLRGKARFEIFCIVCHGMTGQGDGMIVVRGFKKPPTYHQDSLRNAPVGHFFDVITNGWGVMNGYAAQIPVQDRWAIVAYVRALQKSVPAQIATTPAPTKSATQSQQPAAPIQSGPGKGPGR